MSENLVEERRDSIEGALLLGHYRVGEILNEGGMGSVYLAEDTDLGRQVVVKVPHRRFLKDPEFRSRFQREVRELIGLEHPSIVNVLARGEREGSPFLVSPYLRGGSLSDRLRKTPGKRIALRDVLPMLLRIADTLDFVHSRNVVHRDVKPSNILLDEHGHIFLSDFGIAKSIGTDSTTLTQTGVFVGSPMYVAPEQARGLPPSPAADQYALAASFYEVIAGRPPFEGATPLEVLLRKEEGPPGPIVLEEEVLPGRAQRALRKAMARDPERRFPSCRAFAEAMQQAVEAQAPNRRRVRPLRVKSMDAARSSLSALRRFSTTLGTRIPSSPRRRVMWSSIAVLTLVGAFSARTSQGMANATSLSRTAARTPAAPRIEEPPVKMLAAPEARIHVVEELAHGVRVEVVGRLAQTDDMRLEIDGTAVEHDATGAFRQTLDLKPPFPRQVAVRVSAKGHRTQVSALSFQPKRPPGRLPSWAGNPARAQLEAGIQHWLPIAFENEQGLRFALVPPASETAEPYYAQVSELSNAQFERLGTKRGPMRYFGMHGLDAARQPVVGLTLVEAQAFAAQLSKLDPTHTYRLPTSEEWQHAAQAGQEALPAEAANLADESSVQGWNRVAQLAQSVGGRADVFPGDDGAPLTLPIDARPGRMRPNAWGLEHVIGNVWEWTADADGRAALRGGGFDSGPSDADAGWALSLDPLTRHPAAGLRLVAFRK